MDDGLPRDETGLRVCEWCGDVIRNQPATGRRRRYCGRTHRELAYRERKTLRRIGDAVAAVEPLTPPVPSVDETRPDPVPSVDETRGVPPLRWSGLFMGPLLPDE